MEKKKSNKKERVIYISLIIILVLFGMFKDNEAAQMLIKAVKDAFSILIIP